MFKLLGVIWSTLTRIILAADDLAVAGQVHTTKIRDEALTDAGYSFDHVTREIVAPKK